LVFGKCEQLDAACNGVLADPAPLIGYQPSNSIRLVPVVVVGGGYPVNPFTMIYVAEFLTAKGWLADPRIDELCIIDLSELEMLEGLAQFGGSPTEVLREWKASGIANMSLRNFILRTGHGGRELRPKRMERAVNDTFERVLQHLKLRGEPVPDEE
jgi:hypothetical protein